MLDIHFWLQYKKDPRLFLSCNRQQKCFLLNKSHEQLYLDRQIQICYSVNLMASSAVGSPFNISWAFTLLQPSDLSGDCFLERIIWQGSFSVFLFFIVYQPPCIVAYYWAMYVNHRNHWLFTCNCHS